MKIVQFTTVLVQLATWLSFPSLTDASDAPTSSVEKVEPDPNLHEMSFDLGYGPETFHAYVQPDISSFTRGEYTEAKTPKMKGHACKFFNMSPEQIRLLWVPDDGREPSLIAKIRPFHTSGTASFPGHNFIIVPDDYNFKTNNVILQHHSIDAKGRTNNYFYDPMQVEGDDEATRANMAQLTLDELSKYETMRRNKLFNEKYLAMTGRDYLAMYPRQKPSHFMWRADYFGQAHWVTTKETHFTEVPEEKLKKINKYGTSRILKEEDPRLFSEYREPGILNMTLEVISCAPRAFAIENFLSDKEVDHILNHAKKTTMRLSTTGQDDTLLADEDKDNRSTRTSYNTWVGRETDEVFDAIYRRAADLLRIDEALFRYRSDGEHAGLGAKKSIAESLQLVHYDVTQEYTAHHDFGYAPINDKFQGARFATLLLYLNEDMEGGETEFPRYYNGETRDGLKIVPKRGKAALFYNQLPDGNMDDFSQHSANPIISGEKFLINLWVHDPVYEQD